MAHLLSQAPTGSSRALFGEATPALALAVRLAGVCKLWRRAAAQATCAMGRLQGVQPASQMQPRFLSPLLAELLQGRRRLWLDSTLLVAPNASAFLDIAKPKELVVSGPGSASAAVGATLAKCSSILRLMVVNGLVLTQYPQGVQSLTVSFCTGGLLDQGTAVLESVRCLPQLAELSLDFCAPDALPCSLPQLPCLRRLVISISVWPDNMCGSLGLLEAAAEQGVHVHLAFFNRHDEDFWEMDEESDSESEAPQTLHREHVWAALAQVSLLDELSLSDETETARDLPASARELQLLASVRCRQLVLHMGMESPFTEQLVHTLKPEFVVWHHASSFAVSAAVRWPVWSSQPGVYVMGSQSKIGGTIAHLPVHSAPWALVFERALPQSVSGLPAGSHIESGPCGHAVWRNGAATNAVLVAAYERLGMNTEDS